MHLTRKCPHRNESVNICQENNSDSENTDEEINIASFTEKESNNEIFAAEALKLAVIDTACAKTVAGEDWYIDYINNLSKSDTEKLQILKLNTSFKFADGHKVRSFKKVKIPASIGGIKYYIDAEIVKEKIPLLLSKQSLKNAEAVIDIANDKIKAFGRDVDLYFSTGGHYCLDIFPIKFDANKIEEILILENDLSLPEKTSQITKIHKQF